MDSPQDGLSDRLKEICGTESAGQMLARWYFQSPDRAWTTVLQPYLAGLDQISCVRWADRHKLPPLQGIALMLAFLAGSLQRSEWVHYAIVNHLRLLLRSGVTEATLPLAVHSWAALDGFGPEDQGASLPRETLALSLMDLSPRDAIRYGLMALKGGNFSGLRDCGPLLHRFGLTPADGIVDLNAAAALNQAIGSPIEFDVRVVASAACVEVRRLPVRLSEEVSHAPPAFGDGDHYIFNSAGKSVNFRQVDIVSVSDAIFSVDLSKIGQPEFYTIVNGVCISDLSFGVRPFVTEDVEKINLPLMVTADAFSCVDGP